MISKTETLILEHQDLMLCIRAAKLEDIDKMFQLAYNIMDDILQAAFRETGGYSWKEWIKSIQAALLIPDEYIRVIELIGQPTKFIGFFWASSEEIIWLTSIILAPEWQNKGIGKLVMMLIENQLRTNGQEYFELGVQEENPAINFYKKLGFKPVQQWEGRTIIMQKRLEK